MCLPICTKDIETVTLNKRFQSGKAKQKQLRYSLAFKQICKLKKNESWLKLGSADREKKTSVKAKSSKYKKSKWNLTKKCNRVPGMSHGE